MSYSAKWHEAMAKQKDYTATELDKFFDGGAEAGLCAPGTENPFAKDSPQYWGFIAAAEERSEHVVNVANLVEVTLRDRSEPSYETY